MAPRAALVSPSRVAPISRPVVLVATLALSLCVLTVAMAIEVPVISAGGSGGGDSGGAVPTGEGGGGGESVNKQKSRGIDRDAHGKERGRSPAQTVLPPDFLASSARPPSVTESFLVASVTTRESGTSPSGRTSTGTVGQGTLVHGGERGESFSA